MPFFCAQLRLIIIISCYILIIIKWTPPGVHKYVWYSALACLVRQPPGGTVVYTQDMVDPRNVNNVFRVNVEFEQQVQDEFLKAVSYIYLYYRQILSSKGKICLCIFFIFTSCCTLFLWSCCGFQQLSLAEYVCGGSGQIGRHRC